jgi:hypothetical protein
MRESAGVMEHCKISNSKHQITNKYQIPIFNDQNRFGIWNFGHCDLFDIWDLGFGISLPPVFQIISQSLILHVPAPWRSK